MLRGLHGDVAKKELNLLQFAAGGAAEPSTTSTEIVRCEFANADLGGELLDDMPDELFSDSFALPEPWSEQVPGRRLKQISQTEAFARCPQFPGGWSVWK